MTKFLSVVMPAMLALISCLPAVQAADSGKAPASLKEVFADDFLVGAAVNRAQIMGEDPQAMSLVKEQFNTLTAENAMKWERIHPLEDQYDWEVADALVQFAQANDMYLNGHVLVWHQQVPDWVFEDADGNPASRELLLARMQSHINAVVGRYRGQVQSWEVLNEALNEDGSLRQTPWLELIGADYIAKAFEFAHRADPDAKLYYNDFNLYKPEKRAGAAVLVRQLQEMAIDIHGIGMQGHYSLDNPDLGEFEDSIKAFSELGVPVFITELDMSVLPFPDQADWGADITVNLELSKRFNPYADGLPRKVAKHQAERYAELFRILLAHRDAIGRVVFWGVNDGHSWKNGWPMRGRTDYPLLFDRDNQPKRAFQEVIGLIRSP